MELDFNTLMSKDLGKAIRLGVVVGLVFSFLSPASARPEADILLNRGANFLETRDFQKALAHFEQAYRKNPENPQVPFFLGVVLNRLGRHEEALEYLKGAEARGLRRSDLAFELGWACLGTGRWREALSWLAWYDKAAPGLGLNAEFLGRVYLGLGQYKKAEVFLKKAARLDPNLKPSADFFLTLVAWAKKGREGAAQVQTLLRTHPKGPSAKRDIRKKGEAKPWELRFSAGAGHNSNAIALGEGAALPGDISRQNATFARFTAGGDYGFELSDADQLNLSYQFLTEVFDVSNRLTLLDHLLMADYRHRFSKKTAAGFRLSNEHTMIRKANFRNQTRFRPAFGWRLKSWWVAEAAYALGIGNYFFPSAAVQDRDNFSHTLVLNNFFSIPKTRWKVRLGFLHAWNLADGNDFDFVSHGLNAALSRPIIGEVAGDVYYSRTFDRYSKTNSLAAVKRKDDVSRVGVQATAPLLEHIRAYLSYNYVNNDSNINAFSYDQHVGSAGFLANW